MKYVARASVAVPFVLSVGFGLAACTALLSEWYGRQTAYWIMAAALALVGVLASVLVSVKEHEEEVADEIAEQQDTSRVASEVAAQAPLAIIGGLLTLPGGADTTWRVARLLGKNYALVLLIVLLGVVLWPNSKADIANTVREDLPERDVGVVPSGVVIAGNARGRVARATSEAITILLALALGSALAMSAIPPGATHTIMAALHW
jgi:hypothetical protein